MLMTALLCALSVWAQQPFAVFPAQLAFGDVDETQNKTLSFQFKNVSAQNIVLTGYQLLDGDGYDHKVFSLTAPSQFPQTVAAGDSLLFSIDFQPVHNVFHNSELLIFNDQHRGPIRIDLTAQGTYSNPYYNSTQNLRAEALKTALKARLALGYTQQTYNTARDKMFMEFDNQKFNGQGASVNTLACVYTGQTITNYQSRTEAQNMGFNTEHTFPQSFFNSTLPQLSDLFHLFPTTDNANNTRANYPFGNIAGTGGQIGGGSQFLNGVFEPRDAHKGRCGRAMMYFCIRYQDYSCFFQPQEDTLVAWHYRFLPDNNEQIRNAAIYSLQKNRNPFIDYPQFAERISDITSCKVAVEESVTDYLMPENEIDFGTYPANTYPAYYFTLTNTGNTPIQIQSPYLLTQAYELASYADTTVAAGESYQFRVQLVDPVLGLLSDSLLFELALGTPAMVLPFKIPIQANGVTALNNPSLPHYQLYPNPAQNYLELLSNETLHVGLHDAWGRRLFCLDTQGLHTHIDLRDLPEGVYGLEISNDKGRRVEKIIRTK